MKKLFLKISVELPKPTSPKKKTRSLLHAIEGGWYVKKLGQKLPPLKKRRLSKKSQEKGYKIKRNYTRLIKIGMIVNLIYNGTKLSG